MKMGESGEREEHVEFDLFFLVDSKNVGWEVKWLTVPSSWMDLNEVLFLACVCPFSGISGIGSQKDTEYWSHLSKLSSYHSQVKLSVSQVTITNSVLVGWWKLYNCTQIKFFFEMSSCSCWLPESPTGMTVWVSRILPSATAAMRSRIRRWDPPLGDGNCFALETGISTVEFQQHKSRKGGDFKVVSTTISVVDVHHYPVELKLFFDIDWLGRFKIGWLNYQPVNSSYQTTMTTSSCFCWPKVRQSMTLVNYSCLRQLELSESLATDIYIYIFVMYIEREVLHISTDVRQSIEKPSQRM